MRGIALAAIRLYQRHISPRKGFACAYRVHTGRCSCSALGLRAIRRWGLVGGWRVLRARLRRCGIAHRRFAPRGLARQGGFCDFDVPCDCDAGGLLDGCSSALDVASCCDGWGGRRRKDLERERGVRLPVHRAPRQRAAGT